jgi:hypothetical protein
MNRRSVVFVGLAASSGLVSAGLAVSACSSNSASPGQTSPYVDAATGTPDAESTPDAEPASDAGPAFTRSFPSPPPGDPGAGAVYVTISGESNALTGYPFPPKDFTQDTYMFDGWQFVIHEYIVNVDKVALWSNPNLSPTDQSMHGNQVAHLDGPFVVDLHKGGTLVGQGGAPEEATPLGVILEQNDNGNASFDPTATYGFGFSTVQASYDAYNVNLDSSELADFDLMVQKGYSVFYSGTATWMGDQSPYGCTQTNAGAGPSAGLADAGDGGAEPTYVDGGYDYTRMPKSINFKLGFATPTNYVNCQNMTLQGTPNPNEDYPRGIQVSSSQSTIAQVTVHMDHPFWESFAEDSPVHWDQIAAQYVGVDAGSTGIPEARTEDMIGVPFYAFTDHTGTPLPWRNCAGSYYTPPGNGQMAFSTLSVPVNPQGTCSGQLNVDYTKANCPSIRDYYDYIRYTQSTQGHLNSQGLCFIDRQYPAPAGGS